MPFATGPRDSESETPEPSSMPKSFSENLLEMDTFVLVFVDGPENFDSFRNNRIRSQSVVPLVLFQTTPSGKLKVGSFLVTKNL